MALWVACDSRSGFERSDLSDGRASSLITTAGSRCDEPRVSWPDNAPGCSIESIALGETDTVEFVPSDRPGPPGYDPSVRRGAALVVATLLVGSVASSLVADPAGARVARSGVQIQLLDPGASPRGVLRLRPVTIRSSRTVTFSTQLTQSGASSDEVGPLQIQTVVSYAPSPVGRDGTFRVSYSYGSFELLDSSVGTPQQFDAVRTSLAQIKGLGGRFTLSSTGAVLSSRFQIPSTVNSTARSLLQQLSGQSSQLSVPLPTQAVGIGARWRGTTQLVAGGIKLQQTYVYTLRSRDGTQLTLDVSYTQTATPQHLPSTGLPSGETVNVTSYHVAGTGTTVLDLAQVAPVSGHVAAQGLQVLRVQRGGQSGTINQQLKLAIDLAAG